MSIDIIKKIILLLGEVKPYEEINEETKLIDDKILDSMSVLVFVTLLEDNLDIEVPDEEITRDNFANVGTIEELISRLKEKTNGS